MAKREPVQLSPAALQRLDELIAARDPLGEMLQRARRKRSARGELLESRRRSALRLPPPGSLIRRVYQGREIIVRVLEDGFEYEGERYKSLTAIARAVTGAHWNGRLFFGFVKQQRSQGRRSSDQRDVADMEEVAHGPTQANA